MKTFKTVIYWVWSCTWGIIMTAIGAVIALGLLITGHKPKIFHYNVYFAFGTGWGGVNFGAFFFVAKTSDRLDIHQHEAGHGLQNILLGPLMPFVVAIPSAFRCVLRDCTFTGKKIVAGVVTALVGAVGLAGAILGFLYGLAALGVVGLLMASYAGIIALWAFRREIPQYAGGAYVDYDAVWFEGCATRWGQKFFKE